MSTKHSAHSDLPAEVRGVIEKIRRAQAGFDVLRVWIDSPSPNLPMREIGKLCGGGADLLLGSMKFGARWGTQVQLLQPSSSALTLLMQAIGHRYAVHLSYVEIAWDFITKTPQHAMVVAAFLIGHLNIPYHRQRVLLIDGTTWYWSRRADQSGGKVSRNLVLYADSVTKQAGPYVGRYCAHLEFRLDGAPELAKHGLVGVQDLVAFDHLAFWEQQVQLLRPQSLAALGRWLAADASGTMLRKRAHAYRSEFAQSGIFVLQNAVTDERGLLDVLRRIDVPTVFLGRSGAAGHS